MSLELESISHSLIESSFNPTAVEEADKKVKDVIRDFDENSKVYEALPFVEGEEAAWKNLKNNFWNKYLEGINKIIKLSSTGKAEDRSVRDNYGLHEWKTLGDKRESEFKALLKFEESSVENNTKLALAQEHTLGWLVPVLFLVGGIVSIIISFLLGTQISKTLSKVAESIDQSSEEVSSASSQIATSSQELSESTTEQAASLEQTATALEEITSMISKSTENSKSALNSSNESQKQAEEGKNAVDDMLHSMNEISESNELILNQINESNHQMEDIVKVIQDIGNRTKVINDIVFQTKLLSFNASVEAARAGEHGKGFAVVAEEVGKLAQMSGNAAKEISEMLNLSLSKVQGIVRDTQSKVEVLIKNSKDKIDSGVEVSKRCSLVLEEIVSNVSQVANLSQEISQARREQEQGVLEINKAMNQLDAVTQQNASAGEQAAGAAGQLSNQAQALKESVNLMMTVIRGEGNNQVDYHKEFDKKEVSKKIVLFKSSKKELSSKNTQESNLSRKVSGSDLSIPHRNNSGFENNS